MVYWKKKFQLKRTFNSIFFVSIFALISCNTYYNLSKDYDYNIDGLSAYNQSLNITKPIKVTFNGSIQINKEHKINGYFKIFNDSLYQVVVYSKNVGIELFRIESINDSLLLIDRINKQYSYKSKIGISGLESLNLNGSQILKLLFGRTLDYKEIVNLKNGSFSFNYNSFRGVCDVNSFGYLNSLTLKTDNYLLNSTYSKYNKKYKLPYLINAKVSNYSMLINVGDIKILSSDFKAFKINTNYTKI